MPSDGDRLDPWYSSYAERAHGMRASEVRSLFAVANRPEVVSLAGGMPDINGLPMDFLADISQKVLHERGLKALQYGGGQGDESLRESICDVMRIESIQAHADDIMITVGSQQALDLMSEILIDPGDVIVAEAPSYVGALSVFRAYQADVRHVDMDDDGLIPSALEEAFTRIKAEGKAIKFLYTVPNYHNPAGVCLSHERRAQIVDICERHGVLILEDNPYGLLGFDGTVYPALKSFNPEGVVYLGSFSKTLSPGFRIGWACAPRAVLAKLVLANESAVLCASTLNQYIIDEYLRSYDWMGQVAKARVMYRERCQAALDALEEFLPDLQWTTPGGGFFTWLTLPEGMNAKAMLPRAVKNLVAYTSGTAFFANGHGGNHIRLSFCYPPPQTVREGVRRLAEVIRAEQETIELFGTQERIPGRNGTVEVPPTELP